MAQIISLIIPDFLEILLLSMYGAYKLNQEKQTPHYYTKTQTTAETRYNRTLRTARRKTSPLLRARRNV